MTKLSKTHIMYSRTTQGGETVEEIRRTKIKEAMKETLNVYEKLDLNMTEIITEQRRLNNGSNQTMHRNNGRLESG